MNKNNVSQFVRNKIQSIMNNANDPLKVQSVLLIEDGMRSEELIRQNQIITISLRDSTKKTFKATVQYILAYNISIYVKKIGIGGIQNIELQRASDIMDYIAAQTHYTDYESVGAYLALLEDRATPKIYSDRNYDYANAELNLLLHFLEVL